MKKRSRWNGGGGRIRGELMPLDHAWNRKLVEANKALTEIDYCEGFREKLGWRHGARVRK